MNKWLYIGLAALTGSILLMVSFGCTIPRREPPEGVSGDIDEFVPPPAAQVETTTVLRIAPTDQQVNAGQTTVVEIWVDDVVDLMAVDIQVKFNPTVLQVLDFDSGKDGVQIEPGYFLAPDFVVNNDVDNQAGLISYAISQVEPTLPASGSGVLAKVSFVPVAAGASLLDFVKTQLMVIINDNAQELTVQPQRGQIIVEADGQQPSPTPIVAVIPTSEPPAPTATITATATATPTLVPPQTPVSTPTPLVLADVPPVQIPPDATYGFCYRVQPGDTLSGLGQKFGIDPSFINLANDLNPPGYIFLHQALFIPQQYGRGPNVYTVQFGDTLAAIADACHLPVEFLAQVNMLAVDDPLTLPKGQLVTLVDGTTIMLPTDTIRIETLIIPIPPFPPPSRYPYPGGVQPPVSPPGCRTYPCP